MFEYIENVVVEIASSSNPCDLDYWRGRPLRLTNHAKQRCLERDLPRLLFLPAEARLADRDVDAHGRLEALVFKIARKSRPFFVVLAAEGDVITLYENAGEYAEAQRLKQRRRRRRRQHLA